jgi:HEAT repeat protein
MGIRRSAEDTAVDTLMRITQSSTNKEERLAAVRALAKHAVTNETAADTLMRLTQSERDADVRLAAIRALGGE